MSTIDKKRYTRLLMNMDRKAYMAYQKMTLSSKNSYEMKTAPQTQSNISHLKSETNSKRQSYVDYLSLKNQSSYPFGQTEKRFKWQNLDDKSNLVEVNDPKNRIKRLPKTTNFEGGFLAFFSKNQPKNDNAPKQRKSSYDKNRYEKFVNNTKRVINPELDNDKNDYIHKNGKRMYKDGSQNDMRHSTNGSFRSLIDRTPLTIPIKGKKRFLNRSFNDSINLFSEDYGQINIVRPIRKMVFKQKANHSLDYTIRNNTSLELETIESIRPTGIRYKLEWKK